ncbi:glucuronosyltransferase [Nesidiocoris tenuis]|uniref:UDP-glucuronosyltransferase n=1 Tax=Nesidiocoris tenuis TaxID=355587 RepID=A0ABN7AXR3_9HEMI|nr:glucuronosyltransferase [Nesidiocoris tenuis]
MAGFGSWQLSLLALGMLVACSSAARIFVTLPMPWRSHHFVYHSVMRELAARGHEIDYLAAVPMKNQPPNIRHLPLIDNLKEQLERDRPEDMVQDWQTVFQYMSHHNIARNFKTIFSQDEVKKLLESDTKYDIVMSEFHLYQDISLAWVHKFKALAVCFMVLGDVSRSNELNGLPDNPSYMVDFMSPLSDEMSIFDRLYNTAEAIGSSLVHAYCARIHQNLVDEFMRYPGWETRPPLSELASDMALVLVNSHPAVSYTTPKSPHVKEIGGMTLTGSIELPKDLKSFMDSATDGVIFFNLGTNVDLGYVTRDGKLEELLKMFRRLKQKVIIKWTGDNMPHVVDDKIQILAWVPQQGILAHNNTKLFITHGGLQGTMETVYYGVPIVGIPIFADQPKNVKFMVIKGCGVQIDKRNMTGAALEWAINEVISNPKYKEAILKRSSMMRDSLVRPVDEAVYWIEYVLKHGKVLQPASVRLPFYKLYLLDVLAIYGAILLLLAYVTKCLVKSLLRMLFGGLSSKSRKSIKRD